MMKVRLPPEETLGANFGEEPNKSRMYILFLKTIFTASFLKRMGTIYQELVCDWITWSKTAFFVLFSPFFKSVALLRHFKKLKT